MPYYYIIICFYHDVNLAQLLSALPLFGSKKIYNFPLGSMNKGVTVMDESQGSVGKKTEPEVNGEHKARLYRTWIVHRRGTTHCCSETNNPKH